MSGTPPTRPVLRARYDHRQNLVIEAAAEVFATQGFHATTVQDLVTATGLAPGGLYHYIGGKDDLLVMICDQLMEPLLIEVEKIVRRPDPADLQLRELVRVWVAHVESHRSHMQVFQQERHVLEHGDQWQRVRDQRKRFERVLADVLARGEAESVMSFADRDLALRALLGMVNHTAQWFDPEGRLTAHEIADGYVDLLLRA
jgi:TetR/AcrR family transcriptional regulator, cholesterol catabolism regulator